MLLSKVAGAAYIFNMAGPRGTPTPKPGSILPYCASMTNHYTALRLFLKPVTPETKGSEMFPESLGLFILYLFQQHSLFFFFVFPIIF